MMRLFVTGGTGFIGSHFLKLALDAGHDVVALRRPGGRSVIPLAREPEWCETPLDEVPAGVLRGCTALVHFAAQGVSPQPTDWARAFEVNVLQSLRLFLQAGNLQVPHLIACGSCFEYGRSAERYHEIPPDAPLEPIGPYAASKAAFSMALQAYARDSFSACTILRPFHVFGDGQHESNFWPSLRRAARAGEDFQMTAGEQIRDYLPVQDAARAFLAAACAPPPQKFQVTNLGSGQPQSLANFARRWWREWQAPGSLQLGILPYRDIEVMRFVPQLSPLRPA